MGGAAPRLTQPGARCWEPGGLAPSCPGVKDRGAVLGTREPCLGTGDCVSPSLPAACTPRGCGARGPGRVAGVDQRRSAGGVPGYTSGGPGVSISFCPSCYGSHTSLHPLTLVLGRDVAQLVTPNPGEPASGCALAFLDWAWGLPRPPSVGKFPRKPHPAA